MFSLKIYRFLLIYICVSLCVSVIERKIRREGERKEGEREERKRECVYKDYVGNHGVQKKLSAPLGLELYLIVNYLV